MTGKQRFLEAELKWVETIRRSSKIELIQAAAEREQEIHAELEAIRQGEDCLLAANFSDRNETPEVDG